MDGWTDGPGDHEILGYDEPEIKAEEFWFYSVIRDAGELIRKHGAKEFLAELDERARDSLVDEITFMR